MSNYYELRISINPNMEEIVSDICFSNFDCEGVVLAEEAYKDLEMTSTTRGTLRVFLRSLVVENFVKNDVTFYPPLEGGSKSPISGWGHNSSRGYSEETQSNAKELRNNLTLQENKLWQYLRKSQLGYKFRRQQPIGKYIVDFFCPELGLIIELDGGQHNETLQKNYDENRDNFLSECGYKVIRIWNNEIDRNIAGVIEYIQNYISSMTPPPGPLPQGAGETLCSDQRSTCVGAQGAMDFGVDTNEEHKGFENNYSSYNLCSDKRSTCVGAQGAMDFGVDTNEEHKGFENNYSSYNLCSDQRSTCVAQIQNVLQTERALLKERGFSDEELGSWEITLDEKENQDWSKKWKEKWTVTHVTDKVAVVPSWLEYTPKEGEITITLDPGCAFGTGTHQTTQLCMKALEKYMPQGAVVADIGTGSGILAIYAMKLGAKSAYGCDIDETVIDVCRENAKINNVDCTFELNTADRITEKYDFVCANILHNVLFEIMGDLKNIMKDTAKMSLSGILNEKKQVVLDAIKRENLKIIDTITQDQWISYVVEK